MTVDIVYVTHNRRAFTEASFEALIQNTNWELVQKLHIRDDESQDGTLQYLLDRISQGVPCNVNVVSDRFGGPVNALNSALDNCSGDFVSKIDNDVILCPGWLEQMLGVLQDNPVIDALGMEPGFGDHVAPLDQPRYPLRARWIGGVFVARAWCFRQRPSQNDRFFGLTAHWRKFTTAWISPALPVFLLDHVGVEPWSSLAKTYIDKGWARPWESYFEAGPEYYEWWTKQQVAA